MDFWRIMILLMVLTGESDDAVEMYERRSVLPWEADEADEDLRNEVRSFMGEKRAVSWWKRVDCMVAVMVVNRTVGYGLSRSSPRCSGIRKLSSEAGGGVSRYLG